jgi:hypothetical protein
VLYPVIIIPSGVKTPVAAKAEIKGPDSKALIATHDVYVRSLNSNNTPSTTKATHKDWENVIQVCFDNREADIGRFLRRHLTGLSKESIAAFSSALSQAIEPQKSLEDILNDFLKESEVRFDLVLQERKVSLPPHGTWQAAFIIQGHVPEFKANKDFLRLLGNNNPSYTGWPVWLDSTGIVDQASHPYVINKVWEEFMVSPGRSWASHIDFYRFDPTGRFYLRRALEDDLTEKVEPLSSLDPIMMTYRVIEAIAVGIAFAKGMGCESERAHLAFAFKWTRLKDRTLKSWANPARYFSGGRRAYQDEVAAFVNLPLETPLNALGAYVKTAIDPLMEIFNNFELSQKVIDDLTNQLITRKL